MPINLENKHWTLAVVYVQERRIHYYDSMSGGGDRHLKAIRQWLADECEQKQNTVLDVRQWQLVHMEEHIPQQCNGFDCGIFAIVCASFISDNLPLLYSQLELADMRLKVCAAIMRGTILY
jgi:sentrin-specific protease 1